MKIIKSTNYITSFSKKHTPKAQIELNQPFIIETRDCYGSQIKDHTILRSQIDGSLMNPATGPIFIKEVFPGDVISIEIIKIQLNNNGLMLTFPGLGPLGDLIVDQHTKIIPIKDGYANFNKDIRFFIRPMIGVIGVAPMDKEISTEEPGDHGGNIDTKEIKEGSKVYLPVFIEGGLLAIGDLHGAMGDGELCGMGIEIGGKVQVNISKVDTGTIKMPIVETEKEFLIIASDKNFEKASRKGILYATQIISEKLNLNFEDGYRLLSATCDIRISQIVNPLLTLKVAIPKTLIPNIFPLNIK
ncbi:MAG TPA: acetamidase [Eubacteriaceae bacterium]|nr:acetamidase [Eubacteriaceae bacterium]